MKAVECRGAPLTIARAGQLKLSRLCCALKQLLVCAPGDNVELGLKELADSTVLTAGNILCDPHKPGLRNASTACALQPCRRSESGDAVPRANHHHELQSAAAQRQSGESPACSCFPHKLRNILQVVLYTLTSNEAAHLSKLVSILDKQTGEVSKKKPRALGKGTRWVCSLLCGAEN